MEPPIYFPKDLRKKKAEKTLSGMDEALLAYRRAIAADPLERDAQPLYHAGQILMYQGQYEEAEAEPPGWQEK